MSASSQSTVAAPASPSGLQFAVRIFIGCVIVWFVLDHLAHRNSLWALISVITVTEPERNAALLAFNSRIVNTLIGCAIGLCFLYLLGPSFWSILLGIIVSVVLCTTFVRVPGSWRVSPVTVAIVMTPSFLGGSPTPGLLAAIQRTEDVLLGSAVALIITFTTLLLARLFARSSS
jgi:uncharacterized membrane protein YccC